MEKIDDFCDFVFMTRLGNKIVAKKSKKISASHRFDSKLLSGITSIKQTRNFCHRVDEFNKWLIDRWGWHLMEFIAKLIWNFKKVWKLSITVLKFLCKKIDNLARNQKLRNLFSRVTKFKNSLFKRIPTKTATFFTSTLFRNDVLNFKCNQRCFFQNLIDHSQFVCYHFAVTSTSKLSQLMNDIWQSSRIYTLRYLLASVILSKSYHLKACDKFTKLSNARHGIETSSTWF